MHLRRDVFSHSAEEEKVQLTILSYPILSWTGLFVIDSVYIYTYIYILAYTYVEWSSCNMHRAMYPLYDAVFLFKQ